MPFASKSQARFMWSQHPQMAQEWASKTPDIGSLPERIGPPNPAKKKGRLAALLRMKKAGKIRPPAVPTAPTDYA